MNKNIVLAVVSFLLVGIYIGVDFLLQKHSLLPEEEVKFKIKTLDIIDISSLLERVRADNEGIEYISQWELWRYPKPQIKEEKKKVEGEKHYIHYQLARKGNREFIINPEDRKDVWEFYGVFIVNRKPFAIFYNPYKKEGKYKVVTEKDKLNDNILIDKITHSKIFIKFPVAKDKYETLELKVFYVDLEKFKKKLERENKK